VYADPKVQSFVNESFVPVRIHVRQNPEDWKRLGARYGVQWTPTILIVDGDGEERYRIEGFLPVEEFLSQLALGRAHAAFRRQEYTEAEPLFRRVVDQYSQSEAAPEALYWAGVSKYRASDDAGALKATAEAFSRQYADSLWAKKAAVWKG
jgi:hypothetical protein